MNTVFTVTESEVKVDKMQLPYWEDEFAACFYLSLHHMGARAFRRALQGMRSARMSRPHARLVQTPLYNLLMEVQGVRLDERNTFIYGRRADPVNQVIEEMAELARTKNMVPLTYEELRKDLSGERRSVL